MGLCDLRVLLPASIPVPSYPFVGQRRLGPSASSYVGRRKVFSEPWTKGRGLGVQGVWLHTETKALWSGVLLSPACPPWYSMRNILRFVVSCFCCRIAKLVPRCLLLVNSLYRTVLGTDHGVPGPDVPWSDWSVE